MGEYATDSEWVSDGGEQGAVAVAVWAAQDVLIKYARDQCRVPSCGECIRFQPLQLPEEVGGEEYAPINFGN